MKNGPFHLRTTTAAAAAFGVVALVGLGTFGSGTFSSGSHSQPKVSSAPAAVTTTPIKHVVVIFDENISFDHYFGTYPNATNTSGQPFYAAPGTPTVNGLTSALLTNNPNGSNPQRLDPSNVNDLLTCDQNHDYTPEQFAFDNGKMDQFTAAGGTATTTGTSPTGQPCTASDVMNYYDGNTVTALWNYAQHFGLNDNSFGTTFGPSAPGAINLVSGNTGGVDPAHSVRGALTDGDVVADGTGGYSLISDAQPYWDDCSNRDAVAMTGTNIGDLLNAKNMSWGWFQGGFTANTPYTGAPDTASTYNQLDEPGRAMCTSSHNVGVALGGTGQFGPQKGDYIPHHEPFQYYASTANPHHLAPKSLSVVGTDTATPGKFNTANHQYDLSTFNSLLAAIKGGKLSGSHLPAVSFLKAAGYQDGHAGYSDPIDEQQFVVNEINQLESLPTWSSTAIVVAYDDSDGWYDHVYSGVHNPSQTTADVLTGTSQCGTGTTYLYNEQGRCGYGPRLPLLVISPYAKSNFVSNTLTDQSSVIKFVRQNWALGEIPGSAANIAGSLDGMFNFSPGTAKTPALFLSPKTGQPSYPIAGTLSPSRGPVSGGTAVTIKGINFSTHPGAVTVKFGGKASQNVTCSSTTTCVAVTPKSSVAAPVSVTVVVNGVKAVDDAPAFTYHT